MGVANHVFRRGAVYIWRRRIPNSVADRATFQISLRTRDPGEARQIAAVVTAESAVIFRDMMQKRLTPAEARGLFNRVVREETAKLANPNTTLSHLRESQTRPALPTRLASDVYAHAWLRALRHGQADEDEVAFLNRLEREENQSDFDAALRHLNDEAGAHAAPFIHDFERPFAEASVAKAMRRAEPVSDNELLAAYRVILTARAAALAPERGLTIKSAADICPDDDLDPSEPKIPRAWFEDKPETLAEPDLPDGSVSAVAERVIDLQRDEGIKPAQQKQTRQTAKLFADLTGITDLRLLRQRHLSQFTDALRKLPTSYGKRPKDRTRPIHDVIADAAELPDAQRGLSVATINRHLAIIKRIVTRAGSEGIEVDRFLDFDALRRKDSRRGRDKRDSMSVRDVRQLLRHPVFTGSQSARRRREPGDVIIKDALYWLPLLAAYTGARREELAGMVAKDVEEIDGIWCLHLRPNANRDALKNTTSVRVVPIHSALVALGFLDYARSVPQSGNLFPELKRKSEHVGLGADVAYMIGKLFADQFGTDRGSQSFHSLRHYVTDQLRNAPGVEKHVRLDLLGHSGEDIEDEVYGSRAPLTALRAAIETLPVVFEAER